MKLIIISGRSGSGKSTALHVLEDLGFNCIDNLPVGLLPALFASTREDTANCAVSIDARNLPHDLERFPEILEDLEQAAGTSLSVEVIFLDAETTTLVRRFSETRRRHPLTRANTTLTEALHAESDLLEGIANLADLTIDSTRLGHHELRELIRTRVAAHGGKPSILFLSFAFSAGVPVDADLVFDVRCLPNPHWVAELRPLTGRDGPVRDWLTANAEVGQMFGDIQGFIERWLPAYARSNRSYMTVAVGCTGGRHRSVFLTERLHEHFGRNDLEVLVRHRELD